MQAHGPLPLVRLGWIWVAAGALSLPAFGVGYSAAPPALQGDAGWVLSLLFNALVLTVMFITAGLLAVFDKPRTRSFGFLTNCVAFVLGVLITSFGVLGDGGMDRSVWTVALWGLAVLGVAGYSVAQLGAIARQAKAMEEARTAASTAPDARPHGAAGRLRLFVSYRRDDSAAVTDRICEHLADHFRQEDLFRDIDSIPLGVDFRQHVDAAVARCDVLLAVVGAQWLEAKDEDGRPRLHDPADFVRLEIEAALKRGIPVIPLILNKTNMPRAEDLPESLNQFAFHNGQRVRPDPDFRNDMEYLLKALDAFAASRAS